MKKQTKLFAILLTLALVIGALAVTALATSSFGHDYAQDAENTVDGEVIYFSYHHYEQFKNYLNQEFADSTKEPAQYAIADLQNGTVSVLDFSQVQ